MGRLDIRDSYGAKLGALLVITTILVGGVGVGIYHTVDSELTESTEAQLEASAASDAAQIDNWQRLTNQQFVAVTRASAVGSGDTIGAHSQLTGLVSQREIVGTALVNRTTDRAPIHAGRVEVTDEAGRLRSSVDDRVDHLAATDKRTSYSEPFELGAGPVVLAVTKTPIDDDQVLVSVIDLSALSFELFGSDTDRAGTKSVVTDAGTVVLSSNQTALLGAAPVAGAGVEGDSGVTTATAGQELAVGHAATAVGGWTMTNQISTQEAYGLRETVSKQILLLLGVLVASLGGIGLTVGRSTIRSVTDLAERATTLQDGDLETPIESSRRDEFGDVYGALDSMRQSLREEIAEAEAAHEQAEAERKRAESERERAQEARQEAVELNERLEATAAEFGATMDACADGDLSHRLPTDTDNDAMADIAAAFNAMVEEWEATIREVREFGEAVEAESAAVTDSVASARATSERLAEGMTTIADEATGQSTDIQDVREETETLSATVEEASASATEVASVADEVFENGKQGREAAQAAKDELDAIEQRTDDAAQQVDQLTDLVEEIESVTDLITDIADRTNMLALNARIEAARADDHGFGAVAEEVKALVDETQAATTDIEATIQELKSQTETTSTEMADAREKVAAGTETIESALTAFDSIVGDIADTADGIAEIDRAIADQADSTQAVMSELVTVSEVSTETASAAETAATDAHQQAERMGSVSASADSLSTEARRLGSLLDTFETSADATDADVTTADTARGELAEDDEITEDDETPNSEPVEMLTDEEPPAEGTAVEGQTIDDQPTDERASSPADDDIQRPRVADAGAAPSAAPTWSEADAATATDGGSSGESSDSPDHDSE